MGGAKIRALTQLHENQNDEAIDGIEGSQDVLPDAGGEDQQAALTYHPAAETEISCSSSSQSLPNRSPNSSNGRNPTPSPVGASKASSYSARSGPGSHRSSDTAPECDDIREEAVEAAVRRILSGGQERSEIGSGNGSGSGDGISETRA